MPGDDDLLTHTYLN